MSEMEQVAIKTEYEHPEVNIEVQYDEVHEGICNVDIKEERFENSSDIAIKEENDVEGEETKVKCDTDTHEAGAHAGHEELDVKEEAGASEESMAAALAGLYPDHVVKEELVVGSEELHRPKVTLVHPAIPKASSEAPGYFPCHICGAEFDYLYQVTRHLNEHVRRTFPCPHCSCVFNFESDLDTHQLIHTDTSEIYTCECGEKYPSQELLDTHKEEHTSKDSEGFPCHICSVKLKTKYSLKIHVSAKHLSVQPFSCEECGKMFPAQWRLKEHMKLHTGDSLPCTFCERQFISQSKLDYHLLSHTGEKPHECKVCYKRFSRDSNLKVHMRLHTGQKNFVCDLCEKAFYTNSDLTSHRKIHDKNKPKPFKCPDCESAFALRTQLKNHFVNMHSTETPFSCEACNIQFKSKKTWKYHTMMQHSDEKPHKCSECGKGFLIKHLLEKHMRTHTGERPYACQHCDKSFKSRSNLNTHMGYLHKDTKKGKKDKVKKDVTVKN